MHDVFLDELKRLNTRFMNMGIDVSEQIEEAAKAFIEHDKALAKEVVEDNQDDHKITRAAQKVEKKALKLMALQQPVASDFRNVISILMATGDLERIGENAMSIAWETIRVKGNPRIPEVEDIINEMATKVNYMLDQILKAMVQDDEVLAKKIAKQDDEVDTNYIKARKNIVEGIKKDPESAVASSSYFMVIRLLERIGDHVVNLAQWVVYKTSGDIVDLNRSSYDNYDEYNENFE